MLLLSTLEQHTELSGPFRAQEATVTSPQGPGPHKQLIRIQFSPGCLVLETAAPFDPSIPAGAAQSEDEPRQRQGGTAWPPPEGRRSEVGWGWSGRKHDSNSAQTAPRLKRKGDACHLISSLVQRFHVAALLQPHR